MTDTTGSRADCNPSEGASGNKPLLQDYKYDYLDRLQTYRTYPGGGNPTDEANYVHDALNRLVQETEQHPSFPGDKHITQFSYLGLSGLETEEQQTSKNSGNTLFIKDFVYDVYGHRLAMTVSGSTLPGVPNGTFTYGYDVHGSVSQLVDSNGKTRASYGYTPYGQSDSTLSQGENTDQTNPINPFTYSAKRADTGSRTLDMGVRRFGPTAAHFLTPDFFYGSLADLSLSIDPLTQNRYDLAGGNPISFKEWDGHMALSDGGGTAAPDPSGAIQITKTTTRPASQDSRQARCDWKNLGSYGTCIGQAAETVTGQAKEFVSGVGQGSLDLIVGLGQNVKVAQECGLPQLGGHLDPINCARDIYHEGTAILQIAQHPEVLKEHPVYQDFSHGRIAHGIGYLTPNLALLPLTKGAGSEGAVAEVGPTVGELRAAGLSDAHHIIQNAAVKDVAGYETNEAPGLQLPDSRRGTPHYFATQAQRTAGFGGTYGAERQVAALALQAAGLSDAEVAGALDRADAFFMGTLGLRYDSPLRIPRNRPIPLLIT